MLRYDEKSSGSARFNGGARKKFSLEGKATVEDGGGWVGGSLLLFNLINEVVGRSGAQCRLPGTQCNGGDILSRVNLMSETRSASRAGSRRAVS